MVLRIMCMRPDNPKVEGSNPSPAINLIPTSRHNSTHSKHSHRRGSPQPCVLILCSKSSQATKLSRSKGISRKPASSWCSTIKGETFATSSCSNHWPSATLNQRAVGSPPTRPTKYFNHLHHSQLDSISRKWLVGLCSVSRPRRNLRHPSRLGESRYEGGFLGQF